jgi:O-methyltransferase
MLEQSRFGLVCSRVLDPETTLDAGEQSAAERTAELYLDLLKRSLTGLLRPHMYVEATPPVTPWKRRVFDRLQAALAPKNYCIVKRVPYDKELRAVGKDWPPEAETMVGLRRLDNVQECIRSVIRENIPGDVIETGVWRGGTTIFMRAALEAYGDRERTVWVADSFRGLPPPDPDYPLDAGDPHHTYDSLAVSQDDVKKNFRRYKLLDDRVKFLEGWFKDTLPKAPIEKLSLMRLDGDMYQSTIDAISALYPKLSVGGYCLVDDYLWHKPCARAIEDYRSANGITEPIEKVDWTGVYWRRER